MALAIGWALRLSVALIFALTGLEKFSVSPYWSQVFDAIGLGQWLRYFTGAVELIGGLLFLVPPATIAGAGLLVAAMSGAMAVHIVVFRHPADSVFPGAYLIGVVLAFLKDPGNQAGGLRAQRGDMTDPGIPFILRVVGEISVEQGRAITVTYQLTGHAQVDGPELVVQWGGTRQIAEVGPGLLRQAAQPMPVGRARVPVARLLQVDLRGRWWRPRIELVAADPAAFAAVPGAAGGRLRLYLSRRQRAAAQEWVTTVQLEMADHALRAAEAQNQLPPHASG